MPDKIAEAFRLVSEVPLWRSVAQYLSIPEEDVKNRLRLIVERRNKIAHEADLDPSAPGTRWPIDSFMVTDAVKFLEKLGEAIKSLV